MTPFIKQIQEKIDARVLRERALILLTLLAVVYLLFNLLVQSRFDKEQAGLRVELDKVAAARKAADAQLTALVMAAASDPGKAKKAEVAGIQKQIAEVESHLSKVSQGLVSAQKLPKILEEVLLRTGSLTLLSVKTLPAHELKIASVPTESDSLQQGQGTGVYKHEVLIRVSGSYKQLLQLLKEIETLEWKFYWESLDYSVSQFPQAEIVIRVFTLSSEEGLLGV